jgi:hypothetical protein
MSNKIEQFSRILHHRLTGTGKVFTVPTSNDHTDETWSETDLYIGELGINVSDDKIYMRTNNGIVQLSASSSVSGASGPWTFNAGVIEIGSTYSATSIIRNSSAYTDLGNSSLRFNNIYLGGNTQSITKIDVNTGFTLEDTTGVLISSLSEGSNSAPIQIAATSSSGLRQGGLHLQTDNSGFIGSATGRFIIGSSNITIDDISYSGVIGATGIGLTGGNNMIYIGKGFDRDYQYPNSVGIGSKLVIRGVEDDGSGQYNESEIIKGQSKLRTTDALTTPIVQINWVAPGEVIQLSGKVLGVDMGDASLVYSANIFLTGSLDGLTQSHMIGNPIVNELDTFDDGVAVIGTVDNTSISIKVKGTGTNTIQWLCSWEYQKLINIV